MILFNHVFLSTLPLIGKMIASGRLAKLEGELALQKNLTEEMKKNQLEMDEFMAELDEVVTSWFIVLTVSSFLRRMLRECSRQSTICSNSSARRKKLLRGGKKF